MNNRKKILEMIQRREISSEQGMKLLQLADVPKSDYKEKELNKECITYFKEIIAKVTKIPVKNIHSKESFDRYGLDSVVIVSLNEEFEKRFGKIPQTIFFEYRTVQDLANYFLENYRQELLEEIGKKRFKDTQFIESSVTEMVGEETTINAVKNPVKSQFFRKNIIIENSHNEYLESDIAIIGINGMFPLSKDLNEFWSNLETGRDCITEIPKERWDYQKYYSIDNEDFGNIRSKWGGFMENMDQFDPLIFNISPREANYMDPQERLFLKSTWNTLEDAGYTKNSLSDKKVGVFAGVWYGEYQMIDGEEEGKKVVHMSSYSSVANRVSYFFDFNGPCMAIDTMCSSSLTAIHLACDSLRKGESDFAIAGGVNVSGIVPHKYLFLSQGRFLSTDGRCRAFGEGGTGYVPGEGVGTLLLKPLKQAVKDRDNIYAVIKGSAINHGGRTNGFSVPNPVAQGNAIYETLQQAHINPETIGYIEAHGTGTSLGDPIEIKGLVNAFRKYTNQKQYCAIGSVKSNIGHLESAAGIAGVIKVLLQMKHQKLVPSIHTEDTNSSINFKETPFIVQRKLENWDKRIVIENGIEKTCPRRAGISAFGAGGSNAHILIEDYEDTYAPVYEEKQIIVLSAPSKKRLHIVVQQLLTFIKLKSSAKVNLGDLAYTLQVGREAMKEKVAFLVMDLGELEERLERYLKRTWEKDLWWDNAHFDCEWTEKEIDDEEIYLEFLISLGKEKKYETICNLWASGVLLSWEAFYQNGDHPQRISLPTYPFDERKCWVPRTEANDVSQGYEYSVGKLHPMIDCNESTLFLQCYKKTFLAQEFYIRDHVIDGSRVVPGVAYIEMARAAAELAGGGAKVAVLKNIIWATPIVVSEGYVDAFISFNANDSNVSFEISTLQGKTKVAHANGSVEYCETVKERNNYEMPLDIDAIKQRSKLQRNKKEFYEKFSESAYMLGSSLQSIEMLYCNEIEALTHLVLPAEAEETFSQFLLCPSLMDGALQTFIGLVEFMDRTAQTVYLPFAVERVELIQPLQNECYAYLVKKDQKPAAKVYDIVLTDMQGNIAVNLSGYSVRELKTNSLSSEDAGEQGFDDIVYYENIPILKERTDNKTLEGDFLIFTNKENQKDFQKELISLKKRAVFAIKGEGFHKISEVEYEIATEEQDFLSLCTELRRDSYTPQNIIFDWGNDPNADVETSLKHGVYPLLGMTKAFMNQLKPHHKVRLVYSYKNTDGIDMVLNQAMDGFIKTVARENPNYFFKLVELGETTNCEKLLIDELTNSDEFVCYENQKRYARELREVQLNEDSEDNILQQTKVFLITGGMGAIGQIFAKYLSQKYHTKLILTGRSLLNDGLSDKISNLEKNGTEVLYVSGDIAKKEDVERIVEEGIRKFGAIDGVIHAAGFTRDSFILKKKTQELEEVLGPKVYGTIHLEKALRNQEIKVFILCSSISAVIGNVGQCDYAYANSFMDAFARWCQTKHRGWKVISMNWPLWKDGRMTIEESIVELMKKKMGIVPMTTMQGMDAFETALGMDKSQLIVFTGDKCQVQSILSEQKENIIRENKKSVYSEEWEEDIKIGIIQYLKDILSKEIQLEPELIDITEKFENYGIDSVMVMNLSKRIEKNFEDLPKTLFFEYSCIDELGDYFVKERTDEVIRLLKLEKEAYKEDCATLPLWPNMGSKTEFRFDEKKDEVTQKDETIKEDNIAIIGLGLKYPKANDAEEFWNNLKSGRDCITEIPKKRWNFEEYFNPDKNHPGTIYSKWGGFIDGIDEFDPMFFKIAEKEAEFMDPQERIFLQVAYHTLEDSGYTKEALENKTVGVYVGVWFGEYQLLEGEADGVKVAHTSSHASIANRVSYCFDFKGPSIGVDTMCSSSITAIHLACESLRSGDIDVAIAGGVNISGIHPDKYLLLCQGTFVSSDGKCRSFGEGGDGYVPGEGAGAVMLKPLQKALEDKDQIYGVIKASALNHGGKTSGYSVPNPNAQAEVIGRVLEKAKVNPRTIGYIEAHGTGTALGDPIEIQGLTKVFRKHTEECQFCPIGSVKSNIGHLESAAGIAGITKVLLQMKYKKLLPSINAERLNENINFANTPFYVQREYTDWEPVSLVKNGKTKTYKRRAGVSSFGAGGANAHIVLEEFDDNRIETAETEYINKSKYLIIMSAWNEERLKENASNMLRFIKENVEDSNMLENIKGLFAEAVHIDCDEIDLDEPIKEYIDDVLMLTKLASSIDEEYHMKLTLFDIQEVGSIRALYELVQGIAGYKNTPMCTKNAFLANFEYALQTGKEEMFERIAMVVSNVSDLIEKLTRYCHGDVKIEGFYKGNTRDRLKNIQRVKDENLNQLPVEELIRSQNWDVLAKLWVLGTKIAWNNLYEKNQPVKRLQLPKYSFAKEKYWGVKRPSKSNKTMKTDVLHPLVQRNISSFRCICFESDLLQYPDYLLGNRLDGESVFAVSVIIEAIRIATTFAGEGKLNVIESMRFAPVFDSTSSTKISIRTIPKENGAWCEVCDDEHDSIYAQAKLRYVENVAPRQEVTIESKEVQQDSVRIDEKEKIYDMLALFGYQYGEWYHTLDQIDVTQSNVVSKFYLEQTEYRAVLLLEAIMHTAVIFLYQNRKAESLVQVHSLFGLEIGTLDGQQFEIIIEQIEALEQPNEYILSVILQNEKKENCISIKRLLLRCLS